jgi:hypothetical protein
MNVHYNKWKNIRLTHECSLQQTPPNLNSRHQITSKRQRSQYISTKVKSIAQLQAMGCFTFLLEIVSCKF